MTNNYPSQDEYERQMAKRRRGNRIMLLIIGAVLLVLLAFSQNPNAALYLLGIFIVVGIMLYARSFLEKRYKRKIADARRAEEEREAAKAESKVSDDRNG